MRRYPMIRFKLGVLAHEWLFGGYLAITWSRLVVAAGLVAPDTLVFLAFIAANVALIAYCERHPTPRNWRLRLAYYPIVMNLAFQQMRTAVPLITPDKADAQLRAIDAAMIGGNPSLVLEPYVTPWLTELCSCFYVLFFPYLLVSIAVHLFGDLELLKKYSVGLFSLYGLGFLGYTLVPASGPYLAMAGEFTIPLDGFLVTGWNAELVRMGSSGVDVFPSLHVAISCFILLFDRWHRRWRYRAYLLPCVGLWFSTVYLRYHYLIDLLAGFALAAVALTIAGRFAAARGKEE